MSGGIRSQLSSQENGRREISLGAGKAVNGVVGGLELGGMYDWSAEGEIDT
jgi:hypothetical protein